MRVKRPLYEFPLFSPPAYTGLVTGKLRRGGTLCEETRWEREGQARGEGRMTRTKTEEEGRGA